MRRSVAAARGGCRGQSNWVSRARRTRLGASTSWRGFVPNDSYQQGLAQFHEVLRPDGRELVSMNKAFEMAAGGR